MSSQWGLGCLGLGVTTTKNKIPLKGVVSIADVNPMSVTKRFYSWHVVTVVVECCCILIIYYCWQAPSASLPSRARRMTSFVILFRSVGVERLAPRPAVLLLALFFTFGNLLFDAPAQCLSVGWSWRASRMTTFFKNSFISWEVYRFLRWCLPGPFLSDVLYIVLSVYGVNCVNHRVFMFLCLFFGVWFRTFLL